MIAVYLQPDAEADLESISDYIARDNPAWAVTFLDNAVSALSNTDAELPAPAKAGAGAAPDASGISRPA